MVVVFSMPLMSCSPNSSFTASTLVGFSSFYSVLPPSAPATAWQAWPVASWCGLLL